MMKRLVIASAAVFAATCATPAFSQQKPAQSEANTATPVVAKDIPFMFGLFDARKPEAVMLDEDQLEHEEKWAKLSDTRKYRIKDEFSPVAVEFTGHQPGSIVIDTEEKALYFVESPIRATRYRIAVGEEGLQLKGKVQVGEKRAWPRWTPTRTMIERNPDEYKRYADGMDGGPNNPLGARAIYLYLKRNDTYLRIHGTNRPDTIGTASSNGCFRMHNAHVIELFDKVKLGAEVLIR